MTKCKKKAFYILFLIHIISTNVLGGRLGGNVAFDNVPKKGVKFSGDNYSDFDDSDLDIENIS